MAISYLVVRAGDIAGAVVHGLHVTVSFDGGDPVPLDRAEPTSFEREVPAGARRARLSLTPPDPFWPVTQDVVLDPTATPPRIALEGEVQVNVTGVRVVTRGADYNLEVHVSLGELLDVTAETTQRLAALGDTSPREIWRCATPLVHAAGAGWDLVNTTSQTVTFRGKVFFVARRHTPKLLAIAHPGWNPPRNPQQARLPIPFHVFFHPTIFPRDWAGVPYPYGAGYLDLARRYLYLTDLDQGGKGLVYQNNADGPKNVLVFPVGGLEGQMGDILTQSVMFRLLRDLAFLLQRLQGVALPLQPVGSISLSAFSAGANWLRNLLVSSPAPAFGQRLRNVFVLDGVVKDGNVAVTKAFATRLGRWIQSASAGCSLRVYTQNDTWFQALSEELQGPTVATGPAGARQIEGSSFTVLHTPTAFWQRVVPGAGYADVHQWIPAFFLEHAVTSSTFTD